jgi:zinc/manganese transport system substrate-binding protein
VCRAEPELLCYNIAYFQIQQTSERIMQFFGRRLAVILAVAILPAAALAAPQPVRIVAAENFYGDVAAQIGGSRVQVTSILSNPEQDPHMFEASVSTAQALSHARIVVYNGAGYDSWMEKLLAATSAPGRRVVVAAQLLHTKPGDNPHLWYAPDTMPAVAKTVAADLESVDPAGASIYRRGLANLLDALRSVRERAEAMRARYAGTPVSATEPVFGYMARALGLVMRNPGYQRAVMNGVEPSASQIAAFEDDLKARRVKILFYNNQVSDSSTKRARRIAQSHGVPVVGVSETMPAGLHFQAWMTNQLVEVEHALAGERQ